MADNTEEEEEKLKALLRFAQIGQMGSQDDSNKAPEDFEQNLNLLGTPEEEEAFDPTAVAGLGLGGGVVASQTGGLPSTSQKLSPFAQKVAAADAAKASARNTGLLRGLLGRASLPLTALTTGYGVGTALNNTFGLSDKIANTIVGDSNQPALTPEELGQGNQGINTAPVSPTQLVPGIENITLPTTQYPEITFGQQARADGTQAYPFNEQDRQMSGIERRSGGPEDPFSIFRSGPGGGRGSVGSTRNPAIDPQAITPDTTQPSVVTAESLFGLSPASSPAEAAQAPTPEATFTLPSGEVRTIMPGQSIPEAFGREDTGTRTFQVDGGSVTVPSNLAIQTLNLGEEAEARRAQQRFLQSPEARQMTNRMLQSVLNDPYAQASREREARIGGTGSYAGDSAAREARIAERDLRPGETQTERDTRIAQSRTQGATTGGLKMSDAVDLAGGDRDLARTMVVRSRMGMDPMTGKKEEEPFKPEQVEIGGKKYIQLAPKYFQEVKEETPEKETPKKTPLQKSIEDLDADLAAGRIKQEHYDIALQNARNKYIGLKDDDGPLFPTDSNAGTTEDIIRTDGDVQLPTVTDQASYEALQVGDKYLYEGKEYTKN